MTMTNRKKIITVLAVLICVLSIFGFNYRHGLYSRLKYLTQTKTDLKIYEQYLNSFTLKSGEEYKVKRYLNE